MKKILLLVACSTLVAADHVFGLGLGASSGPETMTAAVGCLAFTPLLSPDPGGPDGGGAKGTIGEQLAAAKAETANLTSELATLKAELATAKTASETATTELATIKATLAEKETALATAQADLATAKAATTTAEAEVAKLKGEAKTADERAQEIVASLGFPSTKLPAADDKGDANDLPSSQAELETELSKLKTHKEKSALIRRYEAAKAAAAA